MQKVEQDIKGNGIRGNNIKGTEEVRENEDIRGSEANKVKHSQRIVQTLLYHTLLCVRLCL